MNPNKRLVFKPKSKGFWSSLPSLPGVYVFEDKDKAPLYIGKSVSLKHRIRQHRDATKSTVSKQFVFFKKTKYLNFITTTNGLIAILLEAELIKTYSPKYNAIQKDDKSSPYIVITNPPYSRVVSVRGQDLVKSHLQNPKTQVFGPFLNRKQIKEILTSARKLFGYCQKPFNSTQKPCFYFHLKSCPGACAGKITEDEYKKHLKLLKLFFSGKISRIKASLTREIKKASRAQDFELALDLKNKLINLEYLINTPKTNQLFSLPSQNLKIMKSVAYTLKHPLLKNSPKRIECYDAAHLQGTHYTGSMAVVENGMLNSDQYRLFKLKKKPKGDPDALKEIIKRRLNHSDWAMPDLIILDGGVGQLSTVFPIIPDPIATIALSKRRETVHYYDHEGKLVNLNLPLSHPVLSLFRLLRDESHRLATSLHQRSRDKIT
jgi:excinuclease ABC subunit C